MNTCDEDIEADDKIIAEEGERELYEHFRFVADKDVYKRQLIQRLHTLIRLLGDR